MPASIKTILIGIFVIIGTAIVVSMLLFIHPSVGDNAKTLRIRFTDVDKIDIGTRITFAGHPVGEVVSIKELPDVRTTRSPRDGEIYVYEIEAKVDSAVDIFNTDEVLVRTSGLLGEKNIEINPMAPKAGEKIFQVGDQILYAVPTSTVETTLKKIESALDEIDSLIEKVKSEKIVEGVAKVTNNLVDITHALNHPEKWNQAVDNIAVLTDKARKSWDTVDSTLQNIYRLSDDANKSWPKVDQALDHMTEATGTAKNIILDTSNGKGTIGHLFVGNDLYLQVKSILHKGNTIMEDISEYGILFNTNKRWQRKEAERRRLVQRLSNPYQFANYFNNEMDQISSSLSNVSMILNDSNCDPWSLIYNPDFTANFSELIKNVGNMEETLKLYNEQLTCQEE